MSFPVSRPEGQDYDPIPAGTVQAVCYAVVDLGTQYSDYYKKAARKVQIVWEVPEYRIELEREGRQMNLPRAISKRYTLSLHSKAQLYSDLVSWRGQDFTTEELECFDLFTILGANCLLTITHTTKDNKTYANVASVASLMKDMDKIKSENPHVRYYIPEDQMNIPEGVPDWMKEIIAKSDEHQMVNHAAADKNLEQYAERQAVPGDDVPF